MNTDTRTDRPAHGTAGVLDADTTDGRRIHPAGFTIRPRPIPLLARRGHSPGAGEVALVGQINAVHVEEDTGRVLVTDATADLPPGEYACGMDLANVRTRWLRADGSVLLDPFDAPDDEVLLTLIEAGELVGVTVYLDGTRPAFPGAVLTVEETP